ncbi:ADP-ribosylation factor [Histoplasma capsulatum]|uniref:ADP-ribosylation factor n=1 Tax=Ajellomyces capsulatus TaxID=5037 RepID=A0A8A1ML12_AJECA|nr:predicted protein [Histoplasma mississippiense (nom. inval.)]EDN05821.1 predicted protein [Histoplasma mississippiense (nom. inval.)]QSS65344.1 ADP-ribosylation factor [Histoplasma capsulatum]
MEADGSEDVNDFLNRIRELGNKRDREDEERTRKLEEEIIQGRREREARRAERARSLSPTKDSPGPYGSPSLAGSVSHSSPVRAQSIEPPLALLPSPKREISDTTPATEETGNSDMAKADDLARHSARLSTSSRPSSRGLTWQQRPGSRDLDAGIVPFPTFPSPKSAVETRLESTSTLDADSTPPRSHIAQSLASKDPTWFRQTSDRGIGSPAYRRAQDSSVSDVAMLSGNIRLPGFSRDPTVDSEKRWSNQQTGRGTAVPKPGYQTPPSSLFREASGETSHISSPRPGSSHTETTIVRQHTEGELEPSKSPNDVALKQSLPSRPLSRSDSISNVGDRPSDLPVSPSKTMDSRRWSPTKATWLESALNKPDSPKLKPQFQEEPEWKKGLNNRLRQSKASADLGRPGSPKFSLQKENQPPAGISTQSLRESENRDSANTVKSSHPKLRSALLSDNEVLRIDTMASVAQTSEYPKKLDDLKSRPIASPRQMADSPASPSPIGSQKGLGSITKSPVDGISPQLKPSTPPLNNFRANLRRREITDGASNKDEPEFKNVFGKLRKTETKNYVAPDLLKDNILRGKAGLNATGGPKKSDKIDEFKESILKQKEAMKTGGGSIRRPTIGDKGAISPDKPSPEIPEAITKQRTMTKSGPAVTSLLGNGRHLKPVELPRTVGVQREIKQSEAAGSDVQDPELEAIPSRTSSIHGPEGEASDIVTYARNLPSDKLADIPAKPDQQPDVSLQQSAAKLHNNREIPEQSSKLAGIASKYDRSSIQAPPNGPRARSGTGKLADRLNPALAGLLSRGPPSSSGPSSGSNDESSRPMPSQSELSESILPAKLTHTTKGRAKGPKRRLPQSGNSNQKPQKNEHKTPLKVELTTSWSLRDTNPSDDKLSQDTSPTKEDERQATSVFEVS